MNSQAGWFYLWLLAAGISGGAGDILLYQWAKLARGGWLAAALACWLVSAVLFGLLLRHGGRGLSVSFVLVAVLHVVLVLGWDCAFGGGRLNRWELAGVALGVAAIVALEWGHAVKS